MKSAESSVREAVAYFDSADDLESAIDELLTSGFNRAEISLLATESAVEEKLHHKYRKVSELEDDPEVPRASYLPSESLGTAEGALVFTPLYVAAVSGIGAIVASGGSLLAVIIGAVAAGGTGGAIGSVFAKLVGDRRANYIEDQLKHGGLLLWVRTWDKADEARAVEILNKHSGHDVHVHGGAD